jgi:hypothetical protein
LGLAVGRPRFSAASSVVQQGAKGDGLKPLPQPTQTPTTIR